MPAGCTSPPAADEPVSLNDELDAYHRQDKAPRQSVGRKRSKVRHCVLLFMCRRYTPQCFVVIKFSVRAISSRASPAVWSPWPVLPNSDLTHRTGKYWTYVFGLFAF